MSTGNIDVLRCTDCGQLDPGPRELCPACASNHLVPHQIPGRGVLVSSTVIRRPPIRFRADAPYTVAVVDLEDGVRITGRLAGGKDVDPGTNVILHEVRERIPYFRKGSQ